MNKKKAIKIASATVIAASAFTAVAPAQSEAATSLSSKVKTAKATIKKPYSTYFNATKLASVSTVEKQIKAAKTAKTNILKTIKNSSSSKTTKAKYTKEINDYTKYIARAEGYVKGYNAAKKAQTANDQIAAQLEEAIIAQDGAEIKKQYKALEAAVKKTDKAIKDAVYGGKIETLLYNQFTKAVKADLAGALKIAYYGDKIQYWIAKEDLATAAKRYADIAPLLLQVDTTSELGQAIVKYAETVKAEYDAAVKVVEDAEAAAKYAEVKKAVEAKVATYVALAGGELKTQVQVDAAKEAAKVIDLTVLNDADKTALQTQLDAADKQVAAAEEALAVPVVASVKANSVNTVEVTGTSLDKLSADNFSVEGNKVASYNVDATTGIATVTFENKFESAKEVTLTVKEKVAGEADKVSTFKFTYTLAVKSVVANALTVDNDLAGQKVTFKINGEAVDADLDYLKAAGYTVEFQSTTGVFTGGASSSVTGELKETLTGITTFDYKVVISNKDGKVAESSLVEVKVVDKSNIVSSIASFELVKNGSKLVSNTVVLGENVQVANVIGDKADGTKDANLDNIVDYTSSNKAVALVDSTGTILPITAGTTTITIKAGDVTKSFTLTIAADGRVAKVAKLSTSSLKLVESKEAGSVGLVVTDQYGDAVQGLDLTTEAMYDITKVTVGEVLDEIVDVTGTETDVEGKASLTVTPAHAGSGTVKVKVGENIIATLDVSVSKNTVASTRKLEFVDASKDASLDKYTVETTDDKVSFVYNEYNGEGFLLGKTSDIATSGKKYTVAVEEATGKDIIDVAVVDGVITVTAKADTGTAYLVVKEGSVERERQAITVKNSTPTLSAITIKTADKVTTATTIDTTNVLTLKAADGDDIVENITLTTATTKDIRLDVVTGQIYLDNDGSKGFTTGDLEVGTIALTENISGSPVGTTIVTKAGDKGSVVYTVKDVNGKAIATSIVDVEVPVAQ